MDSSSARVSPVSRGALSVTDGALPDEALFDDALAWLDCEIVQTLEIGDHLLCIVRVVEARVLAEGPALLTTGGVQYGKSRP